MLIVSDFILFFNLWCF